MVRPRHSITQCGHINVIHIRATGKKSIETLIGEEQSLRSYLTKQFSLNEDTPPLDYTDSIKRGIFNLVTEDVLYDSLRITFNVYSEKIFWTVVGWMIPH